MSTTSMTKQENAKQWIHWSMVNKETFGLKAWLMNWADQHKETMRDSKPTTELILYITKMSQMIERSPM